MAPYIFYLMWNMAYDAALLWFAAAALTDFLDGFLARWLHADSPIGAYLDPVADKVLLSGSFLVLAWAGGIPVWLAVVVLGRDVLLLAGAALTLRNGSPTDLSPSIWGKWSTVAQIAYVVAVLGGWTEAPIGWVVAGLTLGSGIHYAQRLFARNLFSGKG